jgi:dihydrofolate reductase
VRRAIAAIDDRRGIATDAGIPWDVPADRAYFRRMTVDSTVVMGSATYDEMAAPLPDRRNLVATSRPAPLRPGFERVTDLAARLSTLPAAETMWVIGGAGLYASTIGSMDELYLTRIPGDYGCTKFFPPFADDFVLERATPSEDAAGVTFEIWRRAAD